MKKERGYTLVEVLVAIVVGMAVVTAIYAAVVSAQRSTLSIERKVASHQDTRAALDLMALEIQMASFNPTYASGIWLSPADCSVSANQAYRGIQAATSTAITVESDYNENGVLSGSGNPNEVITYTYIPEQQYITRSSNCGGNQPFLGDTAASGRPRTVRVINTDAMPVFRYFDAQGTELTAADLPARIPDIARVDITLWVESDEIDPSSGQRRRMFYSVAVIPRNHVINR